MNRRKRAALLAIAACMVLTGCPAPQPTAAESQAQGKREEKKMDWKDKVDTAKAAKVPVVLRARLIRSEGSDKWGWDIAALVAEIKNESGSAFAKEFHVAHYSAEPGMPEGESTIYLQPYSDATPPEWKLLNGTARDGVSHTVKP
jgi:hypothetical protein